MDPKDFEPKLEKWFKDWFEKNGKDSPTVIGVSGGKDSTVCLKLGIKYLGKDHVIPVLMSNGTQADIQDSIDICKEFGVEPITVNIGPAYNALFDAINIGKDSYKNFPTWFRYEDILLMATLMAVQRGNNSGEDLVKTIPCEKLDIGNDFLESSSSKVRNKLISELMDTYLADSDWYNNL